jgi:hypothetical protein
MASISQLTRGGSFTPLPGGGFKFTLDLPKSKFKIQNERIRRKVGEARAKALTRVGAIVMRRTQGAMSNRVPRKRPVNVTVGTRFNLKLVALVNRVPLSDKVTSWKTTRNPKGMLLSDIQFDYDRRSESVVVGPAKFPKLNALVERGGSSRRWFKPIPKSGRGRVYGVLTNTPPKEGSSKRRSRDGRRRTMTGAYSFKIRIKRRQYMQKGLKLAQPRIEKEFRDQIRGP